MMNLLAARKAVEDAEEAIMAELEDPTLFLAYEEAREQLDKAKAEITMEILRE